MRSTRPSRRAPVLVLVVALVAAACSSGGQAGEAETTTTPPPAWEVTERDGEVVADTGEVRFVVSLDPFSIAAAPPGEDEPFVAEAAGLFLVRDGTRHGVVRATGHRADDRSVTFAVELDDGTAATVALHEDGRPDSVRVSIRPDDPSGVTEWGERLVKGADELIYGLTERIVDDVAASEVYPEEVGSLDRSGETIEMWITPTMSGYVPFFQSSRGYGMLVDGFMPGRYDVGATDPGVLDVEFEWDPDADAASYHLFYGPDHADVVDAYHDLTGHPPLPPGFVFGHWRGYDAHPVGETAVVDGVEIDALAASDLAVYEEQGLPPGIFRFDRPWAVGTAGFGEWEFDPERFPNAAEMLRIFRDRGWHLEVWAAPWAVGALGDQAEALGYLAPGADLSSASSIVGVAVDLTNPDAEEWYANNVREFLAGPEGRYIDGFVLDRGDESDVPSDVDDVWPDGRNGHQVHNWYPVELERMFREIIDEVRPDDGFLIARAGYTGSQASAMRWGGDVHGREGPAIPEVELSPEQSPSTDLGLRSVLISVQRAGFMGTPFWGHDIGGYNGWLDREVYARWVEVGFASPLMRFFGREVSPWNAPPDGHFDAELMDVYRGYVLLREEMRGYLVDAARQASEDGVPMVRPLVFHWPDEAGALDRWDEWMLGDDLLVAPIWRSGARERSVWIPPGRWVDFWHRDRVVEGPAEINVEAPLAMLPMWVPPDSDLLDLDVDPALRDRIGASL